MARIDYARKRRMLVYAVVLLIGVCCIILSACNKDAGIYDVSDKNATLEVNHFIAKFINKLYEGIGNIGWTVVAFTVILKLILSPLDIWQKLITRKNAKIMERMKPQLEVLQAKYGDDKQKFQQEQMALYKREKYSTFGACLPTIVTLVVFFVIFAGFREMVGWKYACDYQDCYQVYDSAMTAELGEDWENYTLDATVYANAKDKAQTAVYNFYTPKIKLKAEASFGSRTSLCLTDGKRQCPIILQSQDNKAWQLHASAVFKQTNTKQSWAKFSAQVAGAKKASGTDF